MMTAFRFGVDVQQRLLGRAIRAVLADGDREAFGGQRVLVTGAGGSVGSELSRQIVTCEPAALALIDHAEYNLFRIEQELRDAAPGARIEVALGDVSRRPDIEGLCRRFRPHVVFHAAAYKHVTMAERSIVAAARTNVLGTMEVVAAARETGARLVLVSSGKAAEPWSVMGATKRFAELLALRSGGPRQPLVVRFGNILGSSGSVVEVMLRAVSSGQPIPITHPGATRFFMTAEEAASLVLKADIMGRGREVFWLDMGEALRIGDLAERVIALATPAGAPPVGMQIIGLRPGEKMREELTIQGLQMERTTHPSIWCARQCDVPHHILDRAFRHLRRACATGDGMAALDAISTAVDDYLPSEMATRAAHATTPLPTPAPVVGVRPAVLPFVRQGGRKRGQRAGLSKV
jgi:FlaA1/EpsC-like NDP-sugar epimerase